MKKAWDQFVAAGRYCVPGSEEFKIPETAKTDSHSNADLEGTVKHPYEWGDFNKDDLDHDFVTFVIDRTQGFPNRFGLVIFHEPKEQNEIPRPHWVFKDKDLSRSILDGGSGMFLIRMYSEDGTSKGCYVNWDEKSRSYACDNLVPLRH